MVALAISKTHVGPWGQVLLFFMCTCLHVVLDVKGRVYCIHVVLLRSCHMRLCNMQTLQMLEQRASPMGWLASCLAHSAAVLSF